ncbi:unnamed protein product [Caenorhabditis brenneri]
MSDDRTITYMENTTADMPTVMMAVVQASYGIPSLCLMIFCIGLISVGKRYRKSSFYKLVIFDLITNLGVYINTWIAIRLEMQPIFVFILKFIESKLPGLLTWLKYLPYWFFHMHFWTAFLLTLHRSTSILFPYNYERRWNLALPFVVILSMVISHLPKYLWKGFLYEVYIIDGQLICYTFPHALLSAIDVVAVFSAMYFTMNTLNGLAAIKLARKRIEIATSSKSITKKLTRIATAYSLCYTAEVIWSVVNSLHNYWNLMPWWWGKINNSLLVFASDMFTLSLPYILLIFDTNVQQDLKMRKRIDSQQGTVIVSIQN